MLDLSNEIKSENLSQKNIITFLLHSAQHAVTREELRDVKIELKTDINEIDTKFDRLQWLIVSTIVAVLFKEQIIYMFATII
jgi:predicted transcriptional regulator